MQPGVIVSAPRHLRPVGARERGTVAAYGQQQRGAVSRMPIHVAAAASPPATSWSSWFGNRTPELQAARGIFGRLPGPRPATHTPWERFPAARRKLH